MLLNVSLDRIFVLTNPASLSQPNKLYALLFFVWIQLTSSVIVKMPKQHVAYNLFENIFHSYPLDRYAGVPGSGKGLTQFYHR